MLPTVHIMMFGWPIISLVLFSSLKPRTAVLACLFAGWLLLPQAKFALSGLPDYTRVTAVMLGIVVGISLCDIGRVARIRLSRLDLPIVIFCMCPFASSLTNGLGIYDGISGVLTASITYGIPYFIGRLYFADRQGIRDLAVGLVFAVLCYTPLILWELRMSPQLHLQFYGFQELKFHMVMRMGWYRPPVFLQHGLELAVLLASAAIVAFWLWQAKSVKNIGILSARFSALILLFTSLLCRALNGWAVLMMGIGTMYLTKIMKTRVVLIVLVLIAPAYIFGRVVTNWDGATLVEVTKSINQERAMSLQSRIMHEVSLIDKALRRPYFGWAGYDRNRADYLPEGARGKRSIVDSYWILIFGTRGIVGLISVGLVLLWPIARLIKKLPPVRWSQPENAPAAALSMVLLGFTIDCLVNAMFSPIYFVIAGALIAFQPPVDDPNTVS
jgi:hypothetical protein